MQEKSHEVICYHCHSILDLEAEKKILRHEECDQCSRSLHVCRMCDFYDLNTYNECKEPSAERIVDKEKANFCSYFILKGGKGPLATAKEDQLAAANSLFKK